MIHPIKMATNTKAMKPPSNGQYMTGNIYEAGRMPGRDSVPGGGCRALGPGWAGAALGAMLSVPGGRAPRSARRPRSRVKRYLLARRGRHPGHLHAPLLPEHEPHLARRPQSVWVGRAESPTGTAGLERAEQILMKKAVFAACFRRCSATIRHAVDQTPLKLTSGRRKRPLGSGDVGIKSNDEHPRNDDFRKTQQLRNDANRCKMQGVRGWVRVPPAISVAFL
jgi:hypothetical protein